MAEELVGPSVFSYNLTVETPIDIDEMIYILSPEDLPMLGGVNSDGFPVLPSSPVGDTTFYWLEEEVPLPRGILNEDLDGSETDVTMATGDAVKFAVGDGIRIDAEVMIVTAVNPSTEVLTVSRGSASETNTTAATHTTGAEVIGLGTILIEGAVGSANFQGRDKYSNYCQIWTKKINMSRTEQSIKKYGVPSEWARQLKNAIHHAAVGREQAALYGVKHIVSATNRRQTGGAAHFLTTNVDSTTDWLTVESIEAMQELAYNQGGSFDLVTAHPAAFAALTNTTGSERVQTVMIDDARRGRKRAQVVMTEYGEVQLVRNRWVRGTDAFALKRGNFSERKFAPLQVQKLAKTDDTDTSMMVCEGGFQVKGEAHMGRWTGLDSSQPLPADLV